MTCLKTKMFKNILKSTCMYGMSVSLIITCMYDMSVHNVAHKVYMYTQPNHIESEYKQVSIIEYTTQLSHTLQEIWAYYIHISIRD